jgi:hypothetical protein
MDRYLSLRLSQIQFKELFFDLAHVVYEFPFHIPASFTYVVRALMMLEGIGAQLGGAALREAIHVGARGKASAPAHTGPFDSRPEAPYRVEQSVEAGQDGPRLLPSPRVESLRATPRGENHWQAGRPPFIWLALAVPGSKPSARRKLMLGRSISRGRFWQPRALEKTRRFRPSA